MRNLLIVWMLMALLVFGLERATRAGDELEISGFVNATDQEAEEGYFAVGPDAMVVVKQGSGLQRWLRLHSGRRIRLVLGPDNSTEN